MESVQALNGKVINKVSSGFCLVHWHVDLHRPDSWGRICTRCTHLISRLWKCKFKCEAPMQHRGANINNFDSRLVSLWPSSFSTVSLSMSVSQSSSPSLGQPGLLCPSSSFYFMPCPSLARSSSITTRTLHFIPTIAASPPVSCLTHHFIGLHLAFITSKHLYNHRTETFQENSDSNQAHFIS